MRLYSLTDAGLGACERGDPSVPPEYRRILWTLRFHGEDYPEALARRYTAELLAELLDEMEQLGLLRASAAREPAPPGALRAWQCDARWALGRSGFFLSRKRLAARTPPTKRAADTRVLIVEDDPDQRALAELRTKMAGYAVRGVDTARELRQALVRDAPPDLLVLDLLLPDGNGFEVLARLRAHPAYRALPVIVFSAKSALADIAAGLRLGADAYVVKPYSKAVLAEVLRRVLGRRR